MRILVRITACLAAAHLLCATVLAIVGRQTIHRLSLMTLFEQLDLNGEMNLPTYYSSFLLAFAGGLLLLMARSVRESGGPATFQWRLLGFCFLAMSFDEFAGLHERIGDVVGHSAAVPHHGVFYFPWLLAGIPFVLLAGCCFLPFLLGLPARLRNALVLAGAVYVGGAVGIESIGGWYADQFGKQNFGYSIETLFEEVAEMSGVILLIRAILRELAERAGEIDFAFAPRQIEQRSETMPFESSRPIRNNV